jgi:muramidase (phage lysozyme)
MVKIATAQSRTRSASTPLRPEALPQRVNYTPEMFGAGLATGLASVGGAFAALAEQEKAVQKFDTLGAFARFESDLSTEFEQLKQDTPENAANFFSQADALHSRRAAEFLNTIPPQFQPEFAAKVETSRKPFIANAFKFDFDQKNLYFNNVITRSVEAAKIELDKEPSKLEASRGRIYEAIDASGLSEIDKTRQKRIADANLEAIVYRRTISATQGANLRNPSTTLAAADLPPIAGGVLAVIAKRESGGRYDVRYGGNEGTKTISSFADHPRQFSVIADGPNAGKKSSASGKYQFIEGTWDAAARMAGVKDFTPQSQDRAAWAWAQKTVQDQTGKTIDELIAGKNWQALKTALGSQWEGVKNMSVKEIEETFTGNAGKFADYARIEADPRFKSLTLEQRNALRADGEREANAIYANQIAGLKQQEDSLRNQLYTSLFDGKAGQSAIDEARKAGWLSDYDQIAKAQGILEKKGTETRYLMEGTAKLDNNSIWLQDDADDKARANALLGKNGMDSLTKRDESYVNSTLLPRYEKMGMVAGDAVNALTGMLRNPDPANGVFAMETLRRLREINPAQFASQFGSDIQKELDFYTARRNLNGPEAAIKRLYGEGSPAARQAQVEMRKQAQEKLDSPDFKVQEKATEQFSSWIGSWFGGYGGKMPAEAQTASALTRDFKAAFIDNFALYDGDEKAALEATNKDMSRIWGVTNISGKAELMRFPPDKAGYPPVNGKFDWVKKSVYDQLKLPPGSSVSLISDETTEKEVRGLRVGREQQGPPIRPSYLVSIKDATGQRRMHLGADGRLVRIDFELPSSAIIEAEEEFARNQAQSEINRNQSIGGMEGFMPPQ